MLLIPKEDESILYVHGVNYEAARQAVKNCTLYLVKRGESVDEEVSGQIKNLKLKRIGFDTVDASVYLKLVRSLKNVKLEAQGKLVQKLREVKDKTELSYMRRAAEITSEGMKTAFEIIRPGLREYEIAAEIEYAMRRRGSDGVAFDPIIASGIRSAFPHGGRTDRKIQRGDLIVLDIGAKYYHYGSDLTRTVCIGKPSSKQGKIHNIVREAQRRAFLSIQAGTLSCDVDTAAREFIRKEGYEEFFVHNLGHGIGLEVHEMPTLSPTNKDFLKADSVVTVEPGIYIVDFGGIRIEDTVLVCKNGLECLTEVDYSLELRT